jgi:uncharacterized protein
MKKKSFYSWREFDNDCDALIELIEQSGFEPKSVICIASGGLALGAKLKNIMKLPLTVFSLSSYDDEERKEINIHKPFVISTEGPYLLIDDICDSGRTMRQAYEHLVNGGAEVRTATLHYKEESEFKPDWFLNKVEDNIWTVYPWETNCGLTEGKVF